MGAAEFVFPNDHHVAWSIMIVLYPYITGLVAGAFIVSALYHVFEREVLQPVAKLALVTALCFCAFATLPLLLHLHHPERAFNIMFTPNATSAMAGFGFIYSFYMLLLLMEVWLVFRPELVDRGNSLPGLPGAFYRCLTLGVTKVTRGSAMIDSWLIRALAILGIPAACVLHGYVGFLFGAVKANPWWSTALMPVIFLGSAVASGIAALLVLYLWFCWRRKITADADCVRELSRYLWIALVVAVSLEGLELLHMAYESGPEWHVLQTLLTTKLSISYGLFQVLIGSVCPFVLLCIATRPQVPAALMKKLSVVSGLLILIQVFSMRWNVVIGGQLFSKSFRGFVEYQLPWEGREGLFAAGCVLVLPLLALELLSRMLPLWDETERFNQVGE